MMLPVSPFFVVRRLPQLTRISGINASAWHLLRWLLFCLWKSSGFP
jgi:hypothetical protein